MIQLFGCLQVVDKKNALWHKKKGVILRVFNATSAHDVEVEVEATKPLGSSPECNRTRLPQRALETVIPAVGNKVVICHWKHEYYGVEARIKKIHEDRFCVTAMLNNGTVVPDLQYEWICKISTVRN